MTSPSAECQRWGPSVPRLWLGLLLYVAVIPTIGLRAGDSRVSHADIELACDELRVWQENNLSYFLLEGHCSLKNGAAHIRADECLAWIDENVPAGEPTSIGILARGNVRVDAADGSIQQPPEYRTQWTTTGGLRLQPLRQLNQSGADHPLYLAMKSPQSSTHVVRQFPRENAAETPPPAIGNPLIPNVVGGTRRITVTPRGSQACNGSNRTLGDNQHVWFFTGGISLIIELVEEGRIVDISADRVVLWTRGDLLDLQGGSAQTNTGQPIEVYLEGNVVIRGGKSDAALTGSAPVMHGKQVYYNVQTEQALFIDGSVETFDEQLRVPLFTRAAEVRQLAPDKFYARNASVTTSPFRGTPGYAISSQEVYLDVVHNRVTNPFSGAEILDPDTGAPLEHTQYFATSYNSLLRVQDVPVFYWPYIRADVEDPLGPIEEAKVGSSDNLGVKASLTLDLWQLIGLDYLPIADRSNWTADFGYYSKRGIAGGTQFDYFGSDFAGIEGPYFGNALSWWIHDDGEDNLGKDRMDLVPSRQNRGRSRFQHRQDLPHDLTVIGEFSYLSDQNLLESFYETEYDTGKDQETLLYVKQARDQWSWSALVQPQVRSFLPQNAWLPRLDGDLIGLSLLDDRLSYFSHNSIGYAQLRPPSDWLLPEEQALVDPDVNTGRFDSRHELDLPLQLGPWKLTPFVVGQFTGYNKTETTNGLGRIYGAAGARSSLPFWRIYPTTQSRFLNVHGLAHKVAINLDYFIAASSRDYDELPYLDQLDDDTSELVRRQNLYRQYFVGGPGR